MNRLLTTLATLLVTSTSFATETLDEIGLRTGTDKSSRWHSYLNEYEQFLGKYRDSPLKFLEIGFLSGNSAAMWDQFFTRGELHFVDIDPHSFEKFGHRVSSACHFHIGDQANAAFLKTLARQIGAIDVILDDGGHTMEQQLTSFKTLFPFVKSGGVYIIEDLHTSYRKGFGGNPLPNEGTTMHFLNLIAQEINYNFSNENNRKYFTRLGQPWQPPRKQLVNKKFLSMIKSLYFGQGMCLIFKK